MKRVAFTLIGGPQWLGGLNYLRNLFKVLRLYGDGAIQPVLFVGQDLDPALLSSLAGDLDGHVVRSELFSGAALRLRALAALATGRDDASERAFRAAGIDAVFESATYYGWRPALPVLCWYPDFQQRHLPHMFTWRNRVQRDVLLRARMFGPRVFMLSSRAAEADCRNFYPRSAGRTVAVPFAVIPQADTQNPREVAARYEIDGRYVFLPNQFWRHKNHGVVVEALALLRGRPETLPVIASGLQQDSRSPDYFDRFGARLDAADLGERFRMLGVIPYADLASLMRGAAALLNPSLFEGWSTTVEEAKAFGVPLLLSDIPVHREQADGLCGFFPPQDAGALAAQLTRLSAGPPVDFEAREQAIRAEHEARLHLFAAAFAEAIDRAIAHHAAARR